MADLGPGLALLEAAGEVVEAPAYPGAKPSLLLSNHVEDAGWLAGLIRATADALPAPKPRRSRAKKAGRGAR